MSVSDFNKTVKRGAAPKESYIYLQRTIVTILTLVDKKGKVIEVAPDYFQMKALYRERPRSYKEVNS
jgi:hypothetical protein